MLLAEQTTEKITEILQVSPKTVANTRYLIKSKLGESSDIELVRLALRQKVMDVAELGMDAGDVPERPSTD